MILYIKNIMLKNQLIIKKVLKIKISNHKKTLLIDKIHNSWICHKTENQ